MKIDLVFLIVLGIVIAYIFVLYRVETMADTSTTSTTITDQVKDAVKQIYLADVEAIRNLSNVATQLQAGGLTVAGNLKTSGKFATNNLDPTNMPDNWTGGLRILDGYASGTMGFGPDGKKLNASINANGELKLGTWTIKENANGHLVFIKDGTKYSDGYDQIPQDSGFIALSQDGNIWASRATGRGWLADNKLNVSGGTVTGQLNVNGVLNMGNNIAMNDKRVLFRSAGDNNHFIGFDGGIDGPTIGGNQNVGIYNSSNPGNPRLRFGEWTIYRQAPRGNCGKGEGTVLVLHHDNGREMVLSDLGLIENNTAWGRQGVRC